MLFLRREVRIVEPDLDGNLGYGKQNGPTMTWYSLHVRASGSIFDKPFDLYPPDAEVGSSCDRIENVNKSLRDLWVSVAYIPPEWTQGPGLIAHVTR